MSVLDKISDRPLSLTDRVYAAVRDAIVANRFAEGQRLTEAGLARELGVSKTPVREALLRLEYVGLIRSGGPGGGQQVVTASKEAIISAYEVRAGLEVQVARAAAERGDAMLVAQARLHAEEAKAAVEEHDRSGFKTGDQNFHLTLSQATQNHLLARFTRDAYDLTSALRQRDVPDAPFSLEGAENHLDVGEAVERGDADTAGSLMRQHIVTVRDRVLRAFADSI